MRRLFGYSDVARRWRCRAADELASRTKGATSRPALLASLSVALTLVSALALAPPSSAALDPGCDRARPAIAHYAGGVTLDPQPLGAPIPCMVFTGPTTDSAALGVTGAGTVFYGPIEFEEGVLPAPEKIALPTIVVRSRDRGASWERDVPGTAGLPLPIHGGLTDWLSVDPETSRVWYASPTLPCGATVSWSDDEGQTWSHNLNSGCPDQGANALIEGPAPLGGEQPAGYRHVVYYCANAGEVPLGNDSFLVCQKSLDGGQTFAYVGSSPDEVPPLKTAAPRSARRAWAPSAATATSTSRRTSAGRAPLCGWRSAAMREPAGAMSRSCRRGSKTSIPRRSPSTPRTISTSRGRGPAACRTSRSRAIKGARGAPRSRSRRRA